MCQRSTKEFEREKRRKDELKLKLQQAVPLKERSDSTSKSPTLKEYKKYLTNCSPPFQRTDPHSYYFEEKIGKLKNEDINNTTLQLQVHLLPRSYMDVRNSLGQPFVLHPGKGLKEFQNEITDPLNPCEPKYSGSNGINKYTQPLKKEIFSSTAKMSIFKVQEEIKDKIQRSIEEQKEKDRVKRFELDQKFKTAPRWQTHHNGHHDTFQPLIVDERVIVRQKDSSALQLQFKLRDKARFKVPKKNPEYFRIEKTVVE
ncbi:UNKNOWN [Stylonychia lemnae]|uniref:Uncharacterized protein n=1 Tax=Stylonychia lemnae TaxID=5949 RepID=A0A078AIW2_STYLE|nr:UNKNOWN [Stylonychia lemnae]|eukprot:CDW81387.1 UNKNOWN [Stylonychia lemnae]